MIFTMLLTIHPSTGEFSNNITLLKITHFKKMIFDNYYLTYIVKFTHFKEFKMIFDLYQLQLKSVLHHIEQLPLLTLDLKDCSSSLTLLPVPMLTIKTQNVGAMR